MKKKISITLNEETLREIDEIVDHIVIRNRSQAIETMIARSLGQKKTAVILAGGSPEKIKLSETEYVITSPIKNTSIIELMLKKLAGDGFTQIFLISQEKVINKVFSMIQNGERYGVSLKYIEEKKSQGTGESIKLFEPFAPSQFLVIYSNIFLQNVNLQEFWNAHVKKNCVSTLLLTTTPDPTKKGIVMIEGTKITDFTQKPKKSEIHLAFSAIFITNRTLFNYKGKSLEKQIFPELAKKEKLNGYITTKKVPNIKTQEDIDKLKL